LIYSYNVITVEKALL